MIKHHLTHDDLFVSKSVINYCTIYNSDHHTCRLWLVTGLVIDSTSMKCLKC